MVWAPQFRREVEDAIAGAVPVPPDAALVVTEGNYLLLPEAPWSSVPEMLDEVWYVDLPDATRLDRLVRRHERYGRTRGPGAARSPTAATRTTPGWSWPPGSVPTPSSSPADRSHPPAGAWGRIGA